ncbi:MAG TPA: hypothetical protein VG839_02660 [Asticcacaulis sp.]|nr:hypothetical protein [Asticcacaulis sp.]
MFVKVLTVAAAATMLVFACPAAAAPKLKAPPAGRGIVVVELINPGFRGEGNPGYTIVAARHDPKSDAYIQESTIRSFPVFHDPVSGRYFMIDDVPAGQDLIWGFNVQAGWQIRFDAGAPHFTVPDGGYVFVGAIDGMLNYTRVDAAVQAGNLPRVLNSSNPLTAQCGQTIIGYTPPADLTTDFADASRFLTQSLGEGAKLQVATVEIAPFEAKLTGGWVEAPTHRCFEKKP